MTPEAAYLSVVLAAALVLFYTGWLRTDLTAVLVMLSLMIPWRPTPGGGLEAILTPVHAVSGFGSTAVIMVASMFVLSAAAVRTGAAHLIAGRILSAGARSEWLLHATVLGVVTLFSAFINDTTTVMIWMPMVLAVCRQRGYAPSRILILLAYASLLGGQGTLIGTRSNVLVSDYLAGETGRGLGFFAFFPVAVACWLVSFAFLLTVGRRLLPKAAREQSLAQRYGVREYLTEVMASPHTTAVGLSLGQLDLPGRYSVQLLEVIRGEERLPPLPFFKLQRDDVLVVQGDMSKITALLRSPNWRLKETLRIGEQTMRSADLVMVEALISPHSELEGRTLEGMDFVHKYGISVLAVSRLGEALKTRPLEHRLRFGDALLLVGHESEVERLHADKSFLLLRSAPAPVVGRAKPLIVLALMALMAISVATRLLQAGFAIPLAATLAVLLRCIGMREAYRAIDLQSLVIVGSMIGYSLALEETGAANALAVWVASLLGDAGPHLILALLLAATILLTQVVENAAVAIILAPIAYAMAVAIGADPYPFLLAVAVCTSAAFMTPIAHESTVLVMAPGGYVFRDYLRLGTPLAVIVWAVTTLLVPLLYPLTG